MTGSPTSRPTPFLFRQVLASPGFATQALVSIMLMAVVNLPLPLLNKVVIDQTIPAGDPWPLLWLGVFAFGVRGMASGFQVFQNFVVRQLMSGIGDRLRRRMMRIMLEAPYERFTSGEIGGQVGRLSSDVAKVENIILDSIRFVVRPLCMVGVMLSVMLWVNVAATLMAALVSPLAVFVTRRLSHRLRELQRQVLERRQDLQEDVTDVLDAIRVVRGFGQEQACQRRVDRKIDAYAEASVAHAARSRLIQGIIDGLVLVPWLVLVVGGAVFIRNGEMSLGDFMLFITFEQLLHSPLGQLAHYLLQVRGEMEATRRIQEVMALPSELRTGAKLTEPRGEVSFEGVSFDYGSDRPVLRELDLAISAGERVAVVGPSGAGKSTLVRLLLGFHPATRGRVRFDGVDLEEIDTRSLRRAVGVVFQGNPMFDASIRDNLQLGKDHLEERLWSALDQAEAGDFVRSLPEGLDTLIGVKGLKLSGGQRQRLAIARVFLEQPAVVILDEATSSLDSVTEAHIQKALERLLEGRTGLTIAHRLATVVGSDRILYLEGGRIAESGTHGELIRRGGAYRDLFMTQVGDLSAGDLSAEESTGGSREARRDTPPPRSPE